jgi:site-specific DNA recombinase
MTTAALYLRRSTEAQDASLDRQHDECARYVDRSGWTLGPVYRESASAWKAGVKRPEFDRMVRDARAGQFDVLVVWEVSRLSRQGGAASALSVVWELQAAGVDVESVTEQRTGNDLADNLNLLIRGHTAQQESAVKSARVTSGKRKGMLEGTLQGWNAPYGYSEAGTKAHGRRTVKVYAPDAEAARIVREIFDGYLSGETPQVIADELTERGIEPPGASWDKAHPHKRRNDPVWHQGVIRSLIANPLLAGFQHYKGVRVKSCDCLDTDEVLDAIKAARGVKGRHEAAAGWQACEHPWVECTNVAPGIIDPATWERAQAMLNHRAKPWAMGRTGDKGYTAHEFLLAGLLWCGHCGERVGARHDKHGRQKKKVGVYLCRGRRLGEGCPLPRIKSEQLDEAVRESFIQGFVDVQATMERSRAIIAKQHDSEAKVIREALHDIEREIAEARAFGAKLDADYGVGSLGSENYERLYIGVRERIEQGEAEKQRLTTRLDGLGVDLATDALLDKANAIARMLRGDMESSDKAQLNQQLTEVFAEFRVSVEGRRIIVDPHLRPEWLPEGAWHTVDFAEGSDQAGVEVVDFVEPVLRTVDLWASEGATSPTGNW